MNTTPKEKQQNTTGANQEAPKNNQQEVTFTAYPEDDLVQVSELVEDYEEWDKMKLHTNVLRGIYSCGYEKPSKIQQRAIVPFSEGRDLVAQAQSGTGKTATFTIGMLNRIDDTKPYTQAIIMAPTRNLANQIRDVVTMLAEKTDVKVHSIIGGVRVHEMKRYLRNNVVHVAVGTPGRLNHMIHEGYIKTKNVRMLIVDEADDMLSLGFVDQIRETFATLPEDVQVGLFSATMPPEILELTNRFMNKPLRILVKQEEVTLDGIRQFVVDVRRQDYKFDTLCDLYHTVSVAQVIIFCNTRRSVQRLDDMLNANDYPVSAVHAEMEQAEQEKVIDDFRRGETRILLATDIIARGFDVQGVAMVINYDLTRNFENYVHRCGRCGRFGKKGIVINFATDRDRELIDELQRFYVTTIEPLPQDIAQML